MRDPYQVLGVPRTAGQEDIKKAYRRLAKRLHPDLNPNDRAIEQRFKEVASAYDLLGDKDKRARFDRGEIDAEGRERADAAFRRAYADAAAGRGRNSGRSGGFDAGSIFDELFGRSGPRNTGTGAPFRSKGTDVSYALRVGFVDATLGGRQRLTLSDGRDLEVAIPPGTRDGDTLRLKGQGLGGLGGGIAGDALVEIKVEPHPLFTLQDHDIHLEVPVTLHEAVQGATVQVPTLDGKVALKIPAGSNTGTVLRLKGRGVPVPKGTARGDQYVRLKVVLPDRPDPELAEFLARWHPAGGYEPRKKAGWE